MLSKTMGLLAVMQLNKSLPNDDVQVWEGEWLSAGHAQWNSTPKSLVFVVTVQQHGSNCQMVGFCVTDHSTPYIHLSRFATVS